jgi:hypothetical protein
LKKSSAAYSLLVVLFWVGKCFGAAIVFVTIDRGALNITMGYSSKNNPAQILVPNYSRCILMPCLEMQKLPIIKLY